MKTLNEMLACGQLVCAWHKVAGLLDRPHVKGILGSDPQDGSLGKDNSFCSVTFEEAQQLAETGWDEGAQAAEKHPLYAEVFAQAQVSSVKWGFDAEEGEVVWDRLLSGADTFLQKPTIAQGFTRGCRILVSTTCLASINEAAMLQRAIDIAAGIYQLEQQRTQVELWSVLPYIYNNQWMAFKVHSTGDLFNLAKIVFFCGHSGLLRRLVFGLQERMSVQAQKKLGYGYGSPSGLSAEVLTKLDLPHWEGDTLLLNTLRSNDIEKTRKTIVEGFSKTLQHLQDSTYDSSGIHIL
jgi:hypothetical protein